MDYKYILFDLDGTLSDSADGVMACIENAVKKMGAEAPGRDVLIRFVGPPLKETFSEYFGFKGEKLDEVIAVFREFYKEIGFANHRMYDGVPQMLERLHNAGKTIGLATSKRELFARQICEGYGIFKYFDFFAGSSDDGSRNEKSEVVEYVLSGLGVSDRSTALMVGDRLYDVEGATSCSIDCMGVLYGYGSREELLNAGAKYIAATTAEVAEMILA